MAKTTVVNRIDTIYIDTENPTVSVNTTVNDAGLKHSITITIRGIPITGISGLAWNKGTANRIWVAACRTPANNGVRSSQRGFL